MSGLISDVAAEIRAGLAPVVAALEKADTSQRRAILAEALGVPSLDVDAVLRRIAGVDSGEALSAAGRLWPALLRIVVAAAGSALPEWQLEIPGVFKVRGNDVVVPAGAQLPADAKLDFQIIDAVNLAPGLRVTHVHLNLTLPSDPAAATLSFKMTGLRVTLPAHDLIALLAPDAPALEGDVTATVDVTGVRFAGGGHSGVDVPLLAVPRGLVAASLNLAPFAAAGQEGIRLAASFGASLLGLLDATLDGTGLEVAITPGGPVAHPMEPRAVGLILALGPVKGTGYLQERDDRRFGGHLVLRMQLVDVMAFGLLRPRPFSLLIVLGAQFTPPIELGLGFTLNAVGGVVGVNYAIDAGGLSAAVNGGHLDDLLFPADPAGAAPRILQTLGTMFREKTGSALVGPTLRLGWGRPVSFLTADVGLIIEVSTGKIFLLGRLRVALPAPQAPILDLRAAIAGTIDADDGLIQLDACLTGSRLLFSAIDGCLALRVKAGSDSTFILSAGGFHPSFPRPENFPELKRLSIPIADTPLLRITFTGYFAITPGTVQVGATLTVSIGTDDHGVSGQLSFDGLIRWEPSFGVVLNLGGTFRLRVAGETLCSLDIRVHVEGPTPCWHVAGRARIVLFFKPVSFPFDEHWACTGQVTAPPPPDVARLLEKAAVDRRSWAPLLPAGAETLAVLRSGDGVLLHPLGRVRFSQRIVPLGVPITRYGPGRLAAPTTFDVTVRFGAEIQRKMPVAEQFARADFFDLSDEQKLSEPAFEPLRSGFELTPPTPGALTMPHEAIEVRYETKWIGGGPELESWLITDGFIRAALGHNAVARSAIHHDRVSYLMKPARAVLRPRSYAAVDMNTLLEETSLRRTVTFTEARALLDARPHLAKHIQLIPAHELRR
jgi:hypothetical protein